MEEKGVCGVGREGAKEVGKNTVITFCKYLELATSVETLGVGNQAAESEREVEKKKCGVRFSELLRTGLVPARECGEAKQLERRLRQGSS